MFDFTLYLPRGSRELRVFIRLLWAKSPTSSSCHLLFPRQLDCAAPIREKAMAPHSSTLAWKIPWTEQPGRLRSVGSLRVGHDWVTSLSLSCIGEGYGNPLQCSCLENPRDRRAWWTAIYAVAQSWTRPKRLSSSSSSSHQSSSTGKTEVSPLGSPLGKAGLLDACANTFLPIDEARSNINTQWNTIQPFFFFKKKKEILQYVTTWTNSKDIMLNEISQSEKQILHDSTYIM